jgi:hypothetical protein
MGTSVDNEEAQAHALQTLITTALIRGRSFRRGDLGAEGAARGATPLPSMYSDSNPLSAPLSELVVLAGFADLIVDGNILSGVALIEWEPWHQNYNKVLFIPDFGVSDYECVL